MQCLHTTRMSMRRSPIIQEDREIYAHLIQQFRGSTDQNSEQRWQWLTAAHIAGQERVGLHLHIHLMMLRFAAAERDWPEAAGQALRLLLVPMGNGTGRLPLGNIGRATVSAFKPMSVSPELRRLIDDARDAVRVARLR